MGMEQAVRFSTTPPTWATVGEMLVSRGFRFQVAMIDGQLAFPNEQPSEAWCELRLRTPQGMVTVRREANRLIFVTWGNADTGLLEQRDALVQAFAESGNGVVEA